MTQPYRIRTISEYHQRMGLPRPEHPLISVINLATLTHPPGAGAASVVFDYYSISLKRDFHAKIKYGQQEYDFDEGTMFFISPGQVFGIEYEAGEPQTRSGWILLIHPDFLWNTPLARTIRQYEYFDYSVHQALFLSEKEESTIAGLMHNIEQEYKANIDKFSQNVIIAQLELLLTYADRFYHRQFITRKMANHKMLNSLEDYLNSYFHDGRQAGSGLPTVQSVAAALNLSASYLSASLKALTGQSTQQHIHNKLIEKAKERLSTTSLTVSEIAYELGFEHAQSFSKLFKNKTNLSPLGFRNSFN